MNAELIAVGTELLMGQIANTNAQYISQKLADVGVNVYFHTVVGDNKERLTSIINLAFSRSDLIIVTGGLGPTKDDLTKETIAEVVGLNLCLHKESEQRLKQFFKQKGKSMPDNNLKQAMMPESSIVLPNDNGTAPGCVIEFEGKTIVLLPGPPNEMKPMLDKYIAKYLNKGTDVIESIYIKIFGISEAEIEKKIIDLIDNQSNPTIAPYYIEEGIMLRITAGAKNKKEAKDLLVPVVNKIKSRFGEYIYSIENKSLEQIIIELLADKKKTISVAESCTGGMIASRLISIPGASTVFNGGIVSYSNEMKVNTLGVDKDTLRENGAVSHQVAKQMAEGIKKVANSDIGVSITGIAGPGGATEKKPVGLVYIGVSDEKGTESLEFRFLGSRDKIRLNSVLNALDIIRRRL